MLRKMDEANVGERNGCCCCSRVASRVTSRYDSRGTVVCICFVLLSLSFVCGRHGEYLGEAVKGKRGAGARRTGAAQQPLAGAEVVILLAEDILRRRVAALRSFMNHTWACDTYCIVATLSLPALARCPRPAE